MFTRVPEQRGAPWAVLVLLFGLVGLAGIALGQEEFPLVAYDFDRPLDTGPYTVMVFQNSKGSVSLSSEYRYSGRRSVEILDVAGDRDFAELQGYFPERTEGTLSFHFAFMTAEPEESFNIALAGPAHFVPERDGIGFWLGTRAGELVHYSNGEFRSLMRPLAWTWYEVDLNYVVDSGLYDLTVRQEGRSDPVVQLFDQPNAVGQGHSKVYKFSFIGDPPGVDTSNVRFFVDDILLSADAEVNQDPFVAPGRRMLFIDLWDYYRLEFYSNPECIPAIDPLDFGFTDADLRDLLARNLLPLYTSLADGEGTASKSLEDPGALLAGLLDGMKLWGQGCQVPRGCTEPPCAVDYFSRASGEVPSSKLYAMSEVMALAAADRWEAADRIWFRIYEEWVDDPRFPSISAHLGILGGDLFDTEGYLAEISDELPGDPSHPLVRRLWSGRLTHELALELEAAFPNSWHDLVRSALVAEHRYFVLLWQGAMEEAAEYARHRQERARLMGLEPSRWFEREADVRFWSGDVEGARRLYEETLEKHPHLTSVLLKLSDVYFQLGDFERERFYREAIYGRLVEKPPPTPEAEESVP